MLATLKEVEFGYPVANVRRNHEIRNVACYQWKNKFYGMPSP